MAKRIPVSCFLIAAAAVWAGGAAAYGQLDPQLSQKVKSAYLINFVKYTQWPDTAFGDKQSPIVIGVLGEGDMAPILEAIIRDGKVEVEGRKIIVQRFGYPYPNDPDLQAKTRKLFDQLKKCHLLFVCDSEASRVKTILEGVKKANVLTVSDMPGFAERGGMLGLVLDGKRYIFHANPDEIQDAQLKVPAKVLKLASKIVKTREE